MFKQICCWLARDHITELGNQRPTKPFYFLKPWSSIVPPTTVISKENERFRSIKKAESPVLIPKGVECHYEVELAVIIRNDLTNLAFLKKQLTPKDYEATWTNAIAGYAIGILPILLTDSYQPSIWRQEIYRMKPKRLDYHGVQPRVNSLISIW